MKKKSIYILLFLILSSKLLAQNQKFSGLDSLFHLLDKNNRFMGTLSIAENGKIVYSKSIGKDVVASGKESDNTTKYRIGSISKMFTACLIFTAIEERKLNLNETIYRYFPKIKNAKKITIGNLLNHRSGIHNYTNDTSYFRYYTQQKSQDELLNIIASAGSDFTPNNKAEYSNSNYVLLTYILQIIYKKSYEELLFSKIIQKIGLKNTYLGKKINPENKECFSYQYAGKWEKEKETHSSISLGAGGIVSTPEDLLSFISNLFDSKIISTKSLEKMKTLQDGFGMGIFSVPFYNELGFGHTGGIDGYSSFLYTFPDKKISIALTSNGSRFSINDIAIAAMNANSNLPIKLPSFYTMEITTKDLDKYLGTYSNAEMPIKIVITKEGQTLMAHATGQASFSLEPTAKDSFEFLAAGIKIIFTPEKGELILMQGGGEFKFIKVLE